MKGIRIFYAAVLIIMLPAASAIAGWEHINLSGMTVLSIGSRPDNSQYLFAGTQINGLYASYNGGTSWDYRIATNVPITDISYDPWTADSLYAIVNDSYSAGLHKSSDDGNTWDIVYNIPSPRRLAFDFLNAGYIYICFPTGIMVSQDYGRNLMNANNGLPALNILDVMGHGSHDLEGFAAGEAFVAKTTDFGASWSDVGGLFGLEDYNPSCMAFNTDFPDTIYVACYAYLARSFDGGANWDYFSTPSSDNEAIACDPDNSEVIYIGSLGGGVYVSYDGGESFLSLNSGLGDLNVHCLAVDAAGRLLAGTEDGVYRYTAEPIPTLSEWGLIILALLLLAGGTTATIRRRKAIAASG